ncbi:MAG: translation initiation factor [Deltaproteobacteria bacterium]|nr:translation initiation factor [Deltaproteobacteria bacterium]
MAKRRVPPPALAPASGLTSNPFAALADRRDVAPEGEAPAVPEAAAQPVVLRGPARAIVRYERAGRGGKEATVVERLGLSTADAQTWCRELKRQLGCGGGVEGEDLVFAGDQRTRLARLLDARGVARITVS